MPTQTIESGRRQTKFDTHRARRVARVPMLVVGGFAVVQAGLCGTAWADTTTTPTTSAPATSTAAPADLSHGVLVGALLVVGLALAALLIIAWIVSKLGRAGIAAAVESGSVIEVGPVGAVPSARAETISSIDPRLKINAPTTGLTAGSKAKFSVTASGDATDYDLTQTQWALDLADPSDAATIDPPGGTGSTVTVALAKAGSFVLSAKVAATAGGIATVPPLRVTIAAAAAKEKSTVFRVPIAQWGTLVLAVVVVGVAAALSVMQRLDGTTVAFLSAALGIPAVAAASSAGSKDQ